VHAIIAGCRAPRVEHMFALDPAEPLDHICRSVWEHEPRQGCSLQLLPGALYPPVPTLPGASEKPAGTKEMNFST
jgi:hypothetical protein